MTTILNLYHDCKITKDRNAKVDLLSNYLSSVASTTYTATNFPIAGITIQYQQIELQKKLKLDLTQAQVGKAAFNYAKIYQDNKAFYYFIDKATWKSTSTVEFDMTLDTVNTFADDFTFNKKTHITRQHKNRMQKILFWSEDPSGIPFNYLSSGTDYVIRPILQEAGYSDIILSWNIPAAQLYLTKPYPIYNKMGIDGIVMKTVGDAENFITEIKYGDYNGDYGLLITYYTVSMIPTPSVLGPYYEFISASQLESDFNVGIYHTINFQIPETLYDVDSSNYDSMLIYANRSYIHLRKIDQREEGINPPHFKQAYEDIIEDNNTNTNWYLVYKANSADEDSGVQVQLWPAQETSITIKDTLSKVPGDFTTGTYYYVMPKIASKANISHASRKFSNGNDNTAEFMQIIDSSNHSCIGRIRNTPDDYHNVKGAWFCILYRDGTNLKIEEYKVYDNFWAQIQTQKTNEYTITSGTTFTFENYSGNEVNYYTAGSKITNITTIYNQVNAGTLNTGSWSVSTVNHTLKAFESLDRTDSKLMKIIALPYVPNFQWGRLQTNSWSYDNDGYLYLNKPNINFENWIEHARNPLSNLQVWPTTYGEEVARNDTFESKLYNSEFYIPKFVYDSFEYSYILENVDETLVDYNAVNTIKYNASNLINSRFLFQFDVPLKRSTSNYDNICIVARNNELPIFSNKYIDYIRSGYNYDVKNKNAALQKGIATTALSTVGAGVGAALAIGAASGSAAGPVGTAIGAGVGAAIGLATSLISLANSQSQADRNIQQKLDEANRQATSVAGGDDVDLLEIYTNGNKAKYITYSCSDAVKQTMADLFYYCGYADDIREVPELNTRKWFNFIQCEPVFNESNNTVYKEYEADLKQRYQEGITVYHAVPLDPLVPNRNLRWNWDQDKENWETNLL